MSSGRPFTSSPTRPAYGASPDGHSPLRYSASGPVLLGPPRSSPPAKLVDLPALDDLLPKFKTPHPPREAWERTMTSHAVKADTLRAYRPHTAGASARDGSPPGRRRAIEYRNAYLGEELRTVRKRNKALERELLQEREARERDRMAWASHTRAAERARLQTEYDRHAVAVGWRRWRANHEERMKLTRAVGRLTRPAMASAVSAWKRDTEAYRQRKKDAAQAKVDGAQQAVTDATAAQKTATDGKKAADTAVNTSNAEHKKAEDAQKAAATAAQKANDEKTASERAQAAAKRSVERAETSVQKAADAIVGFEATHKGEEAVAVSAKEIADKAAAEVAATEQPYTSVAFTADGNIAVGSVDQRVWLFSGENGAPIDGLAATGAPVKAVAVAGNQIISVSENKAVGLWHASTTWNLIQTIGRPDSGDVFVDRVTALDFSADGQLLAAAGGEPSRSGEIKIFNVEDGSLVMELDEPHSDTVFAVDFSRDGQYIASCGSDRFIKVFQVNDGSFVRSFEGHTHHVLGVAWSADGRELASSGADMVVKIWDFRTGDQKRTISGFSEEVTSISYVGDSINVVGSCGDKNVHIKRADNGGNVRALSGSTDFVYSVAASADGKIVIAGGQDSTVRFWQADNGQSVATFEAPQPAGAVAEGDGE